MPVCTVTSLVPMRLFVTLCPRPIPVGPVFRQISPASQFSKPNESDDLFVRTYKDSYELVLATGISGATSNWMYSVGRTNVYVGTPLVLNTSSSRGPGISRSITLRVRQSSANPYLVLRPATLELVSRN